ncbi:glycosyltransferase family 2 protein [Aliisedimentitalea scapharcae]|uniref:Glycosyltransferase family 2 protein n=1 Tax=Aliisedimentitalea scapharcae TaxID=1524259 RepID=A0ABZ2XT61_9RHOB
MTDTTAPGMRALTWLEAYRMRWKRRRLLWRSFRSRRQLTEVVNRTRTIAQSDILVVLVVRNEAGRIPYFLEYYRKLGAGHFLVVDNDSDDGSDQLFADQPDVSLWRTSDSYRASRFGLDWMTWLQIRYADGHWCLMVDVDELLVFPVGDGDTLQELSANLEARNRNAYGAVLLDLYPQGSLGMQTYVPGQDPTDVLTGFDAGPFRAKRQYPLGNLWVQGGARERVFFADDPARSPTLNKLPLVKWSRRYAYVNSTHSMLPPQLNGTYDGPTGREPGGVLLHTKFLPEIVSKSEIEKQRQQHFHTPADFDGYYDRITQAPDMSFDGSLRYTGRQQLEKLGLLRPVHRPKSDESRQIDEKKPEL